MSDELAHEFREVLRDTGFVVGLNELAVQCIFLESEISSDYDPELVGRSYALDAQDVPEDPDYIDEELRWLQDRRFPVSIKTVNRDRLTGSNSSVELGGVVHRHVIAERIGSASMGGATQGAVEYCVGPRNRTEADLTAIIKEAKEARINVLAQAVGDIRRSEELETIKGLCGFAIEAGEEIKLFDDAEFLYDGDALKGVKARFALVGPHTTPQIVEAYAKPYEPSEFNPLEGTSVFFATGGEFVVPHIFPFDAVDESGAPLNRDGRWLEVMIATGSQLRYARDSEERKVRITIGEGAYWAQPDKEMLLGNQNEAGEGVFIYDRFKSVSADGVQATSPDSGNSIKLQLTGQKILVPADEDLVREIRLEFLGL